MMRLFFAIDIDDENRNSLKDIIVQLQKSHKENFIHWTQPEHFHITLQFIGELESSDLTQLIENVQKELALSPTFSLEWGPLELFPSKYQAHIISLRTLPPEPQAELAETIGRGIQATGYEVERRPYRGHLTLARLKKNNPHFRLAEVELAVLKKIAVKEIILYQSNLSEKGPKYSVIEKFKLNERI